MRLWTYLRALWRWPWELAWRVTPAAIVKATPWGIVRVPVGFKYDGASNVPDLSQAACAVHDWLYATGRIDGVRIRQDVADNIYARMLADAGFSLVDDLRRLGLARFGGYAWVRYRRMEDRGEDPLAGRAPGH